MTKFLRTLYNRIVAWMNQPHLRRPIAAMLLLSLLLSRCGTPATDSPA